MNVDMGSGPTRRRYSPEQKASAVRMVIALREELGTEQGTVKRVADQLGYGVESVRSWVKQADVGQGRLIQNVLHCRRSQPDMVTDLVCAPPPLVT